MAEMTRKTTAKAAAKTSKFASKPAAKKPVAKPAAKKPIAEAAAKKPLETTTKTAVKARKPAAKVVAAPAPPKPAMRVSDEQRYRMVAEAAYYRAESNQFKSDPVRDWIEAESDITILLSGGG